MTMEGISQPCIMSFQNYNILLSADRGRVSQSFGKSWLGENLFKDDDEQKRRHLEFKI